MIEVDLFLERLDTHGYTFFTGVPCSHFAAPIARLSERGAYVPAANEGAAVSLAAGAAATGRLAAVFVQNSGLGNLINPLTSLLMTYRIPVLVFVSMRGWPPERPDEPQHRIMGTATARLLDALGVEHLAVAADVTDIEPELKAAAGVLAAREPAFVLVERGAIGTHKKEQTQHRPPADRLDPRRALELVAFGLPDALMVSTTGYTSRDLFELTDSPRCFYMQGSMGHASAFGLGVAMSTAGKVVILDGDGAALMHLGTMSTIGGLSPHNLVHVIFDNGCYESTGGQLTTSPTTSFADIGRFTGYRMALQCGDEATLRSALATVASSDGPHLIVVKTGPRTGAVAARATNTITAPAILDRFTQAARTCR